MVMWNKDWLFSDLKGCGLGCWKENSPKLERKHGVLSFTRNEEVYRREKEIF